MSRGIVVFAHGSRVKAANEAVRRACADLSVAAQGAPVEAAFLDLARPDLAGAVGRLLAQGVDEVAVVPYFLTLGVHLERDLPKLVAGVAALHPGLKIAVAPPLDGHPSMVALLLDRAREAGF